MPTEDDYVRGVMTSPVVSLPTEATVEDAVRAMIDHDIGAIVVVDGEAPVGVFTERDVTRRILQDPDLIHRTMPEVMSSPIIRVAPDDEVIFVFGLISDQKIRRLPVVKDGRLVGIVTERDLLRWVEAVANA